MNILDQINLDKKQEIADRKKLVSLEKIKDQAEGRSRGDFLFYNALAAKKDEKQPSLIAELKKKSPSKGIIREDFDISEMASAYKNGGADCLSVLTNEKYFGGSDEFLNQAKAASGLPVLRKDFVVDEYQIYESKVLGADCILLIMSSLNDYEVGKFFEITTKLGMDALFEVHDEEELKRAEKFNPKILGVNNRNLKTFEISLEISKNLSNSMRGGYLKICESGIFTNDDILEMMKFDYDGFLVGESLMKQKDLVHATKTLLGEIC